MKRLFLIIALFVMAVSGFGQDRPVFHLQEESITIITDYGANISGTVTRSVYGKVRIVTDPKEHADVRGACHRGLRSSSKEVCEG